MADMWHVARGKVKHGPFTAAKLKELAAQGRIQRSDMLLKEGTQKWVAASTVKGLFDEQLPVETGGDTPPEADNRPPALRENPVGWAQKQFSTNPQRVLLVGGGSALLLLFVVCIGCVGMIRLISGGSSVGGSGERGGQAGAGDYSKGPNGEVVKVEETEGGYPPINRISYYLDKEGKKVRHGTCTGFTKDGTKVSETVYFAGKPRLSSSWQSDGRPNSIQERFDDEWALETTYSYYPNSHQERQVTRQLAKFTDESVKQLKDGGIMRSEKWERINHGETVSYYPNGRVWTASKYERGKLLSRSVFDKSGKLVSSQ